MESNYDRGYRNKRKNKDKKRKRNLLIFLGLLILGGIYFSEGSAANFFKVFVIEVVVSASLFVLLTYIKNRKKRKSEYKRYNYIMTGEDRFTSTTQVSEKEERDIAIPRPVNKNYDWILENKPQEQVPSIDDKETESTDSDVRAEVAKWINNVNYSDSVFKRIIEKSYNLTEGDETKEQQAIGEDGDMGLDNREVPDSDDVNEERTQDDIGFNTGDDVSEKNPSEEKDIKGSSRISIYYDMKEEDDQDCDSVEVAYNLQKGTDGYEKKDNRVQSSDDYKSRKQAENGRFENKAFTNKPLSIVKNSKLIIPPIELLESNTDAVKYSHSAHDSKRKAEKLLDTLASFGVGARIINISEGPSVTRYELQPDYGVKVSKIVNLTDDIALNLAAVGVRIEAPIPGKAAIGIEIPNTEVTPVFLRDVIQSDEYNNHPSKLAFAVGTDIAGNPVVADIALMPHLLIAGATGSGKSVCINTLITSILYRASASEVRLLMIDPKVVELSIYNGIPHLLVPVVTDPKKAAGALNWAVQEMNNRYRLFADNNVRDLKNYNSLMQENGYETLPQVVVIIDELADLMMVAPNDVEDCICRLAQMARAAGMHLVIATQRPSVDVITGVIKANIPSRISFAVSSQIDSRTILDMAGAEKLLGKGDMLFNPLGKPKPVRVQGALITDKEVEAVVTFVKSNQSAQYDESVIEKIDSQTQKSQVNGEDDDELLPEVINLIVEQGQASTSYIQRKFKVGYSRAARILDQLEEIGIVGPQEGSKPRKILVDTQEWEEQED